MKKGKLTYERTRRGLFRVSGRVLPARIIDDSLKPGRQDWEDKTVLGLENPELDPIVREIEREVAADRLAGRLKPFIEGEPIGVLPRRVRVKSVRRYWNDHDTRMEEKRAEMLALRARNDATIESLLSAPWPGVTITRKEDA